MRVNEKIERITPDTLICGIDVGKTKCCARFCDYRGLEVYHKVWFDKTENLDAIGCQITAAMYKENKTDVIIAFEPTGHYWLNIDKYVKPIERDELYQNIYSGYSIYEDIQKEINRIRNKIHEWNDKYFPEVEKLYKIDSVGIKPIYENQLLPNEIKNMTLENFIELMTKDNSRANKKSIMKLKELCEKSNGINSDAFTKKEIKRLYERFIELFKELEEYEKELIELASQIDYVEKAIEITGIGYMSMVGIIAETGNLNNYEHAKQVLKMSGLSLKESSSGQKKGKKHISKRGRSKLRRNLKQIGICLVGKNNFFLQLHNYYTTQREHPLTKLISINAIIRKFMYILMAIV